jgi:hypothetical protein
MTIKSKVFEAFRSSPHRWRSSRAIAKEAGVPIEKITRYLERSPDIIKAKKGSEQGEPLFALREKNVPLATAAHRAQGGSPSGEQVAGGSRYLILLPFDASAARLRNTIRGIIQHEGGQALFLDETFTPGALFADEISRLIKSSDAVIADMSRNNPNVMFEIGMAHASGKPIVLLLEEEATARVPTDLAGFYAITYVADNLSGLSARLSRALRQLAERRGVI